MYIFKAAVIGAGAMGAEIAQVISYSGLPVILKDVDQAMLSLSTYLGHAGVADTYWYLQAVPNLMAVAAQRFDACMPEVCYA